MHIVKLLPFYFISFVIAFIPFNILSQSLQDSNNCNTSTTEFCQRSGSCSIQGADWYQTVTADKSEIFAVQGWPGLCDMTHVALVQGNCAPPQSKLSVTAYLSATSFADIPEIIGPLNCAAILIADGDLAPLNSPDGIIDSADLLIMGQIIMGLITPDASTLAHADIHPEGAPNNIINMSDLLFLLKLIQAN